MPVISVIIPAYNRGDLLPRAVNSVLVQEFADIEILIVDDGSVDNTAEVVATIQHDEPRIRYIRHPVNRGEAAARNTGLTHASGDFIAFLDSDDAWLPGKLHRQFDAINAMGGDVDAIVTGNIVVWDDGRRQYDDAWHFHQPITVRNLLVYGCAIGLGGNVLLRREAALAAGPFDEKLRLYVDVDWLCRFLSRSKMVGLSEPYTIYHKAPYRAGKLMEDAAAAFLTKNATLMDRLSWRDRGRARALFWRSSALGYQADGVRSGFVRSSLKALINDPLVSPGNYVELFDAVMGTSIVSWVRSRRHVNKKN